MDVFEKDSELHLKYKGKVYIVMQYVQGWDVFRFYSLWFHSPNGDGAGLVLITDWHGKIIKEITDDEYPPDIVTYDINGDACQDFILFWHRGVHSILVQAWINQDNKDFQKVFEDFNDKNIRFLVKDGDPTLAFKRESPASTNDNFPDKDWKFLKWNGKTFKERIE